MPVSIIRENDHGSSLALIELFSLYLGKNIQIDILIDSRHYKQQPCFKNKINVNKINVIININF